MNDNIKVLYTCCLDNKVIVTESNLTLFVKELEYMTDIGKKYNWFYRRFKSSNSFDYGNYCFQKVV